jgi:hypothetical protein
MLLIRMTLDNLAIRASARLCETVAIICLLAGVATAAYILKQPAHLPANESPATTQTVYEEPGHGNTILQ